MPTAGRRGRAAVAAAAIRPLLRDPVNLPTRLFLASVVVAAAALVTVALVVGPPRLSSAGGGGRLDSLGYALAAGFLVAVGSALAIAWFASTRLRRRVHALTEMARR